MRWVSTLGTGGASPHREPRDLARRREVALEEGRRDREHRRHVVEAVLVGVVGGQEGRDVDPRPRAGRAPRCGTRPGSGGGTSRCGPPRGRGRRPRSSPVSRYATRACASPRSGRGRPGGGIAPTRSLRMTCSQIAASPATSRQVRRVEGEPRRAQPLVVADDAVAIERRPVRRGVRGRLGAGGRRWRRAARPPRTARRRGRLRRTPSGRKGWLSFGSMPSDFDLRRMTTDLRPPAGLRFAPPPADPDRVRIVRFRRPMVPDAPPRCQRCGSVREPVLPGGRSRGCGRRMSCRPVKVSATRAGRRGRTSRRSGRRRPPVAGIDVRANCRAAVA